MGACALEWLVLNRQSGAAATELVVVFVPMLLVVLGVMQLCLIFVARSLVDYAAFAAARAAIVVLPEGDLPDDERPLDDPPPPDPTPNVLGEPLEETADVRTAARAWTRSVRYARIAQAASLVTASVSPVAPTGAPLSVAAALDSDGPSSLGILDLLGKVGERSAYATTATAVVFLSDDGRRYVTSFDPSGDIVLRTTYLFRCAIPLARRFLCRRFEALPEQARREALALGAWASDAPRGWNREWYVALSGHARMRNEGR